MPIASQKTASISTCVTPELKAQAEAILDQLQIPMSTALKMFLQQIVFQRKIPFETKLSDLPLNYDRLSKETFDIAIKKGLNDTEKASATQIKTELTEDN